MLRLRAASGHFERSEGEGRRLCVFGGERGRHRPSAEYDVHLRHAAGGFASIAALEVDSAVRRSLQTEAFFDQRFGGSRRAPQVVEAHFAPFDERREGRRSNSVKIDFLRFV